MSRRDCIKTPNSRSDYLQQQINPPCRRCTAVQSHFDLRRTFSHISKFEDQDRPDPCTVVPHVRWPPAGRICQLMMHGCKGNGGICVSQSPASQLLPGSRPRLRLFRFARPSSGDLHLARLTEAGMQPVRFLATPVAQNHPASAGICSGMPRYALRIPFKFAEIRANDVSGLGVATFLTLLPSCRTLCALPASSMQPACPSQSAFRKRSFQAAAPSGCLQHFAAPTDGFFPRSPVPC